MMRSGQDCLKSHADGMTSTTELNAADVVSSGRAFQMRGAAIGKARLPTVESLTEGTTRRLACIRRVVFVFFV